MFKNREKGFFLSLIACGIALIGVILYIILDNADIGRTFSPVVCVLIGLAVLAEGLVIWKGNSYFGLAVSLLYALGVGFILRATIGPLSDVWNGVNFIGGNAPMGVAFSVVFLICGVLSIISNYLGVEKK